MLTLALTSKSWTMGLQRVENQQFEEVQLMDPKEDVFLQMQREIDKLKVQFKSKQTPDTKWEKADEGANGGQCIAVGVAHHLQLFDRLSLTAKKVIMMHVMGVKNVHDVLPEISVLAKQIQPQGVEKTKGLKPHAQRLEDLDTVVQWALGGRVTLVDVIDKGGMISLHSKQC